MIGLRGLVVLVAMASAQVAWGQGHLDAVLAAMDASSAKFRSAEAEFQWDFYERVTKSTSTQTGTVYFLRQKDGTEMGARIVQPGLKLLRYDKGVLEIFDPKQDALIHIDTTKNRGQVESFLTLGFGGSGRDLEKAWTIQDMGMETVDGVVCAKLDLVSKDQSVREMFTHVVIWVDTARDVLLKQEFYTPSEDKRIVFNRKIQYNGRVDKKVYEIKRDGKTTVTNR